MINYKGDIKKSIDELKENIAVSYVFNNPFFQEGILNGATITIKDLFTTKEGTTQGSSKILKGFKPSYDATSIEKIKKSGAAIVAKVQCDELGLGGTGEFSAYGLIRHPLDKDRLIGGSSSGSMATFSNNISLALATDTGDSTRAPASYNGFVGFKPSYGAISRFGVLAYASSLDTVGMFSHDVHDVIEFSKVLFGKDEKDFTSKDVELPSQELIKPKKVAILVDEKNVLSPKVKNKFRKFIKLLREDDVEIKQVKINIELLKVIKIVYSIISYSEASSNDANLNGISFGERVFGQDWKEIITNTRTEGFGKMVQRRFTLGAFFLSAKNQEDIFIRAQKVRRLIKNAFNKIYNEHDLLIFPSTEIAPLAKEEKSRDWFASYLVVANLIGNPSISIPFSKIDKMPFGISLDTKLYSDKKLLSYALYIEKLILKGGDYE